MDQVETLMKDVEKYNFILILETISAGKPISVPVRTQRIARQRTSLSRLNEVEESVLKQHYQAYIRLSYFSGLV